MTYLNLSAFGLTDFGQRLVEPGGIDVERFAAFDARELNGAQHTAAIFVVADDAGFAAEGAFDGQIGAGLDQTDILDVGGGGAGEIAGFLHQGFFRADHLGELLAEPFAGVDGVELDVAERIARHFLSLGLHFGHDGFDAGAFGNENVDAVDFVHDRAQTFGFGGEVDFHLRDEHAMDLKRVAVKADGGQPFGAVEQLAVFQCGGGGEPAATAAHHFMDDQHARVGVVFGDDVPEVACALFGSRPGAQRLLDREHIVVDGFGQADNGQAVVVFRQKGGKIGGGGIGVVAADGMENIDAIFDQLVGSDFLRILAFLDQAALHAVLDVGEFDAAVADQRAAETVQQPAFSRISGVTL